MTAKNFNLKDFLINNGIIVVLVVLAVYTSIMQPTFFTFGNFSNIALNVAPRFIIACGVSGCLITKGTDLSAGRQVGFYRDRITAEGSMKDFRILGTCGGHGAWQCF